MAVLNEVIHQPVRLRIMAVLAALPPEMQVTFNSVKDTLDLTDGNLGAHLHKLEEAGYVMITKTFVISRKPTLRSPKLADRRLVSIVMHLERFWKMGIELVRMVQQIQRKDRRYE